MRSKNEDKFRQGADIHLGRTGIALCPITAMLVYLTRRVREAGPCFVALMEPLSIQQLVKKEVRAALEAEVLCPVTRGAALGLEPQPHLQNWGRGLHDPDTGEVEERSLQTIRNT